VITTSSPSGRIQRIAARSSSKRSRFCATLSDTFGNQRAAARLGPATHTGSRSPLPRMPTKSQSSVQNCAGWSIEKRYSGA
jgi:hypothetical protein